MQYGKSVFKNVKKNSAPARSYARETVIENFRSGGFEASWKTRKTHTIMVSFVIIELDIFSYPLYFEPMPGRKSHRSRLKGVCTRHWHPLHLQNIEETLY